MIEMRQRERERETEMGFNEVLYLHEILLCIVLIVILAII